MDHEYSVRFIDAHSLTFLQWSMEHAKTYLSRYPREVELPNSHWNCSLSTLLSEYAVDIPCEIPCKILNYGWDAFGTATKPRQSYVTTHVYDPLWKNTENRTIWRTIDRKCQVLFIRSNLWFTSIIVIRGMFLYSYKYGWQWQYWDVSILCHDRTVGATHAYEYIIQNDWTQHYTNMYGKSSVIALKKYERLEKRQNWGY